MERWASLGIARSAIKETGSIKYDPTEAGVESVLPLRILGSFCIEKARPILFGGSTHAGEEEILADVFLHLRAEFPALVLLLAPRHVERTPEIAALLRARGLQVGEQAVNTLSPSRDSRYRHGGRPRLRSGAGHRDGWRAGCGHEAIASLDRFGW